MGLCSQIHGAVVVLRRAVHRWWQAVAQVRRWRLRIPQNKDCIEALESGFSSRAWLCVVVLRLAAELSRWEPEAVTAKVSRSFFNKACSLVFCYCDSSMHLPPLTCGGSAEFDGGFAIKVWWLEAGSWILVKDEVIACSSAHGGSVERRQFAGCDVVNQLPWSRDTKLRSTISAAVCGRSTLEAIWWPSSSPEFFGVCSTSMRRPLAELAVALNVLFESSGIVPGVEEDGRGSSSLVSDNGGGPNCFPNFLCRVYHVKVRDLVVFSIFVLFSDVKCTRH